MRIVLVFQYTCLILLFSFLYLYGSFSKDAADASSTIVNNPNKYSYIDITKLQAIYIPAKPNNAENTTARMLQKKMKSLYKINLKIKNSLPKKGAPAILVGRELAIVSGMITEEELRTVKHDGYVIKVSRDRIVLAGFAPQGTIYASYAFLRQIGLKIYPWHYSDGLEVFKPLEGNILKPFSISSKPFFEHRNLLDHLDKGRFGGTIPKYALADLRFAQEHEYFKNTGFLNWDHTAGYLVPVQRYYDEHPEYFSMKNNKRISKSTPNHNVTLCTCNSDVVKISSERALEWMDIQKERRYFAITDGDSAKPQCPQCAAGDPYPDYFTDRLLRWVNAVAQSAKTKHPEKILLTAAYQKTVKPPVETQLEPNVLIMYAPWYWTSRNTSAVSFAHPLNPTAMEEFMGWSMLFPEQMGIYDYPADWIHGTAGRIKLYAKNKVRWLYFNGSRGSLLHWVNSQLLWNPLLDTEELESEFVQAFYGPAADIMGKYLRLLRTTIETNTWYSNKFFREPVSLRKARSLLNQAEVIAEAADLRTQTRIFEGVAEGLYKILENTHPAQSDPEILKKDFEHYIKLNRHILNNWERLRFHVSHLNVRRRMFTKNLARLGIKLPQEKQKRIHRAEQEEIFKQAKSRFDDFLTKTIQLTDIFTISPKIFTSIRFAAPDEHVKWRFDSSQTDLVSSPLLTTLSGPTRDKQLGIKVKAPLSRLPVHPRGNTRIHAGRFYVERIFSQPLNVDGLPFLDFHIHASSDVPITIYINKKDRLHSDIDLHAGEQIVRIDLRNYIGTSFNYKKWDKKIRSIAFDIWPQDNFYPYPKAQDTELIFLGMEVKNYDPSPDILPYKGKAIWMTHFRANIPRGIDAIKNVFGSYKQLMIQDKKYKPIGKNYDSRRIKERFRTFTEHRTVSPIFAILTGNKSSVIEEKAAHTIQKYLMKAYGVKLPINPPGLSADSSRGNAIILGKEAGLATEKIKPIELRHVGTEGFVIRARNGRIIIAGADGKGTFFGAARFLEDHGARFSIPGVREKIPDMSDGFLHELYLLDWPYFKKRPIPCGTLLMAQLPKKTWKSIESVAAESLIMAKETAAAIKDHARSGNSEIPKNIALDAVESPLSCYVVAKLLWNPFLDLTRLIREFRAGAELVSPL